MLKSVLVHCCKHRGIRFRFHSYGANVIAVPNRRSRTVKWYEVRRRVVSEDVLQEYLVPIPQEQLIDLAYHLRAYIDDDRDAIVSAELKRLLAEVKARTASTTAMIGDL